MNCKHLAHLIYNCHNIPQCRKDSLVIDLSKALNRTNYRNWKKLLRNGLAVKEEFFRAYPPVTKEEILGDLCEAVRGLKRADHSTALYRFLDNMYCLESCEKSAGEAAKFLRMRLRQNPHKGVRAVLAAVIMELPEEQQRIEDVTAAIHGNYLLSIRAMERLCASGEPGLKALYHLLDEITLTPAITFTLFRIVEETCCRDSLKRTLSAKVFLRANQQEEGTMKFSSVRTADTELRMVRSARVTRAVESSRAPKEFRWNGGQRRRGDKNSVFRRFAATRNMKTQTEGGCHVDKKNHQDTSVCGGCTVDLGDAGKERLRISVQLKNRGLQASI
jgi:hypothetical protein